MEKEYLRVYKRSNDSTEPNEGGYDHPGITLYASETVTLKPFVPTLVSTGIGMQFPEGFYGRFASITSLTLQGVTVVADVADSKRKGECPLEIKVMLLFMTPDLSAVKVINKKDEIAQLIVEPFCYNLVLEKDPWWKKVEELSY